MPRWDITDPDRVHTSEVSIPREDQRNGPDNDSPSIGRAGTSNDTSREIERGAGAARSQTGRARARRARQQVRGQAYSLRDSELSAMGDMGRFRAVDVQDLARVVYQGDEARMKYDLENLRRQGLIEERTIFRAHKPARKMVTLTPKGYRVVKEADQLPEGQRIYHGFVKPKELDHDADLYKVHEKAVKDIEERGGKPIRVRLDFELKESINRAKQAASHLPEEMRTRWLAAVAEEHGLTTDGRTIRLPDIQVEYQTPEGGIERESLELLSRNYREDGIRAKVSAGFRIYARAGETTRIRRALQDTGLVREVLSI